MFDKSPVLFLLTTTLSRGIFRTLSNIYDRVSWKKDTVLNSFETPKDTILNV